MQSATLSLKPIYMLLSPFFVSPRLCNSIHRVILRDFIATRDLDNVIESSYLCNLFNGPYIFALHRRVLLFDNLLGNALIKLNAEISARARLYANKITAKGHAQNTFSGSSARCIGSR